MANRKPRRCSFYADRSISDLSCSRDTFSRAADAERNAVPFVNRVLYIPTDYAEFFPLAKCANVRACQKEDSSRKREGIRNKEREEGEREADGAVCFAYRSAKIPRAATRSGANNIRRESQRRRDERTEKLLSFSLSFSRYVRSFPKWSQYLCPRNYSAS